MTERIDKTTLLDRMQNGYQALTTLIDSLSTEQLLTPGVNSMWSIKDNLAHLTAWQKRTYDRLHALFADTPFTDPTPDMTEDALNEWFYQQNKGRPLEEIRADFQKSQQQLIDFVQTLGNEELNRPLSASEGYAIWHNIAGNTYEHYQEHTQIIQHWLTQNG